MKTLAKIQRWGDTHHPAWFDFFRVALGVTLLWKGIQFATHLDAFSEMMAHSPLVKAFTISLIAHIVIVVHIIGGLMIAIGTHTRLACLFQIPILLAAIFYVNLPANVIAPYAEFWLSVSVLIGLLFFLLEGDGPLSVEHERTPK